MGFENSFAHYLAIYSFKDCIEILFFSGIIYYISRLLQQDKQKPLLLSFYGYATFTTVAYYTHCTTLTSALISFFPLLAVLFCIIHQRTLQKNFVSLLSLSTQTSTLRSWPEVIIQTFLIAATEGKSVHCIIEKKDSLSPFLQMPHLFNCEITEGLLDIFFDSKSFQENALMVINSKGILLSLNSFWVSTALDQWIVQSAHTASPLFQETLFYTTKTDAFFVSINPQSRLFTCITQGICIEQLPAHQALSLLKKHLYSDTTTNSFIGDVYVKKQSYNNAHPQ